MDCKLLSCQTPGVDIRAPLGFPGHEKTIASSSVGLHSKKSVSEGQMKSKCFAAKHSYASIRK